MDEAIIQAYRATDYQVHAAKPFTLRIGEFCAACDALMDAYKVATAAYLTAWNPFSQPLTDLENARAQEVLGAKLAAESIVVLSGEGVGRIGHWPPEPSLFALGISRDKAVSLAQKYQQNAFVWIERGKVAELVLCA
ncbi:DUF3293 domain-containing protein [Lentibacter sp. XHP0401]|uniref:DUF3293 domain-containing protein n=1 Tax=Lentibacter sp. XHP0401 TaxID=2984334 RepID=UPI0021E86672|nr:DUF3293 domain-containing protein [Lentibacter sp. XHP0401]MCV2893721.1 DUF3293 domain-containing protein [Lentibacter sp. XHP0401]